MNNDHGWFYAIDAFLSQKILAITVFVHEMKAFRFLFWGQEANNLRYYLLCRWIVHNVSYWNRINRIEVLIDAFWYSENSRLELKLLVSTCIVHQWSKMNIWLRFVIQMLMHDFFYIELRENDSRNEYGPIVGCAARALTNNKHSKKYCILFDTIVITNWLAPPNI